MGLVKKCVSLLRLQQKFPGYGKMAEVDGCAEENVMRYLKSWNKNLKIDEYGNMYLINPGTPLLCAHMDTVQREDDAAKVNTIHLNNEGIIKGDNIIIGGDDKCGIAIAMEVYEKLGNQVSLLFPRQEETGCNGSREFCAKHSNLLTQCTYCLVLDRKFNNNIISNDNCYCSLEFQNDLVRVGNEGGFDYHPEHGLCSDANNIRHYLNCVNLSVGYYEPHSKKEYIVADDLKKAFNFVMHIVQNLQGNWPIYIDPPKSVIKEYVYKPTPVSNWGKPINSRQGGLFDDNWGSTNRGVELGSPQKGKDKRTKLQKETAALFKIKLEGELQVNKDLILYDEDLNDFINLPAGTYWVEEYKGEENDLDYMFG